MKIESYVVHSTAIICVTGVKESGDKIAEKDVWDSSEFERLITSGNIIKEIDYVAT